MVETTAPRVLIADKMSPRAAEIFKARGIDAAVKTGMEKDELLKVIGTYDGLVVRSSTKVSDKVLGRAKRLKVIGRAGIGVDNIDVEAATARGIVVMNTPFGNSITTAEHAIAMMLACARQLAEADASTRAGKWEKSRFMGTEVTGKTLGLIGCGNIGTVVASRAQGLRMKVLAYDPFLSEDRARDLGVQKVEFGDLLANADFVTLHVPLTDQTQGIIDADAIAAMKDGVRIINCARGGLVDEEALAEGLKSGKVAAAASDVFSEEPARDNPLFSAPNMVVTPHLGAATAEAQENVAVQIAEQISDYLLDGAVSNALNMPSVSAEDAPRLKPYMVLAAQLGRLLGQIAETGFNRVVIEYEGHVAELNHKPLTALVLEGLLKPTMHSVNMVNAPVIARQHDIEVSEVIHEREGDYATLVRVSLTGRDRSFSADGTLFANAAPRIVSLMGIEVEADLAPNMLFITNDDKPGFIGALGSVLGDAGINIGTFNLGRDKGRDVAIALISIDEALDKDVLTRVASLAHVRQVKALTF